MCLLVEPIPGVRVFSLNGYDLRGARNFDLAHGGRVRPRGLAAGRALAARCPGELVGEDLIEPLGLSITKAAELLDVRRATLSDVLHGKAALSADMALRLEKAFGVSMDLLLKMQAGYEAAQARQKAGKIKVSRYVAPEPSQPPA